MLRRQERAAHIDGEHLVPKIDVDVLHLGVVQGGEQGRVVDQDVDLAEALHGFGDQRLDLILLADIAGHAHGRIRPVPGRDLLRRLFCTRDIGDHDARAFRCQRLRIMPPDALGAAGDDGGPSCQSCHVRPSLYKALQSRVGYMHGMPQEESSPMNSETLDCLAIREIVEDWAMLRDARLWDRFRKVWHEDGRDAGDLVSGQRRRVHQGERGRL